mgnify:CR=1 FL=1|tara:strand:+ start:1847 stop:6727 length:4881 start_codon:yes stop_codon:yes gene_type:complete
MAVTSVNLPDGSTMEVNHPEGAREEDILRFAKLQYESQIPESPAPVPTEEEDEFPGRPLGRGLSRGIDIGQLGFGSALEGTGKVFGLERVEQFGAGVAEEQKRQLAEKEQYATRRQDVEDIPSGARFVAETLGEQGPMLGQTLAGAYGGAAIGSLIAGPVGTAIGGIAGGLAVNIPFFYGLNREAQKEAVEQGIKTEMSEGAAILAALPQAALDLIADRFLLGGRFGTGFLSENALRTGNILTRGIKGTAAGTIAEVPTEVGQQILERLQANQDITSEEALTEYVDVAVAAGILGGGVRATSSIVKGDIRKQDLVMENWDSEYKKPEITDEQQVDEAEAGASIDAEIQAEEQAKQADLEVVVDEVSETQPEVEETTGKAKKAVEEGLNQAAEDESVNIPKLPENLEANPKFNKLNVKWRNAIDKALFIVSDPTSRSPQHDEYISFLKRFYPDKISQDFIAMGREIRKTLAGLERYGKTDSDGALLPESFSTRNARLIKEEQVTVPVDETPQQLALWEVSEIDSLKDDPSTGSVAKAINNDGPISSIISRTESGLPQNFFFTFENPYTIGNKIIYNIQDRYIGLKKIQEAINADKARVVDEINQKRKEEGLKPLTNLEIKELNLAPITEEESAYLGEERSHGIIGNFIDKFSEGELEPFAKKISDLSKIFTDLDLQAVEEFLVLRHSIERNKKVRLKTRNDKIPNLHGAGSIDYKDGTRHLLTDDFVKNRMESLYGMKWDDAKEVWTGGNDKGKKLLDIAGDVDSITKGSIDFRVQHGLLSQKDANIIRNTFKYYIPLRGHKTVTDDYSGVFNSDEGGGGGSGLSVVGQEGRRLKLGRTTQAATPLGTLIEDRLQAIQRGVTNQSFSQRILELAKANSNNKVWEVITEDHPRYSASRTSSYNYIGSNPELQGRKFPSKTEFAEAIEDGNGKIIQDGIISDPNEWIQQNQVVRQTPQSIPPSQAKNQGLFGVKVDGEQVYIDIKDDRLRASLLNMSPDNMGAVIRSLGKVNRFLSMINTSLNPEFVLSNFSRDIQTAVWNLIGEETMPGGKAEKEKLTRSILKEVPRSVRLFYRGLSRATKFNKETGQFESRLTEKEQKDFEEYIGSGSKAAWFHSAPPSEQVANLQDLIEMSNNTFKGSIKARRKAIGNFVENINSAVENGVRFASFIKARDAFTDTMKNQMQKELGRALTVQEIISIEKSSIAKASTLAKNLTINFNRKGHQGVLLNSLYLFFNAGVQGTANFMRGMVGPTGNPFSPEASRFKQAAGGSMILLGSVIAMLNEGASDEDENGESYYANIPDWEKERNMIFMKKLFPHIWPDAEPGDYVKIPLPYGYNIFHVFGTAIYETYAGIRDIGEGTSLMTGTILGSFVPISVGTDVAGFIASAVPSAVRPVAELMQNKNFWGSPIYKENIPFGAQLPASQLSYRSTPEGYKVISEFLNTIGGGNESEPGSLLGVSTDISPDVLQHLGEFIFGAAGATGLRTIKVFEQWTNNEDVEVKDIPFWRRLRGEASNFKSQSDFYERREDINQKVNQLDVYYMQREMEKYDQYLQDNSVYFGMTEILKYSDGELRALNARLKELREASDSNPSSAIRNQQLSEQIEDAIDAVYNNFNRAFNRAEEDQSK